MPQNQTRYQELEERTLKFARDCRDLVKTIPRYIPYVEYGKQLTRSSGSVAANYLEANEALGKKDFYHRIKIVRKEAKESRLWLRLIDCGDPAVRNRLEDEAFQLMKIFNAIVNTSQK